MRQFLSKTQTVKTPDVRRNGEHILRQLFEQAIPNLPPASPAQAASRLLNGSHQRDFLSPNKGIFIGAQH